MRKRFPREDFFHIIGLGRQTIADRPCFYGQDQERTENPPFLSKGGRHGGLMDYGYLSFCEQGGWGHFFLLASKSLSEQPSTSQWAQPPCFWLWLRNIRQTTNATRAAMMTASRMDWMFIVVSIIIRYNPLENPLGKAVDTEGANPRDGGLPNHQPHGIPTAHLALHRGYGGHTGRIE